jgi:DNA-binding NtrC family response regulator
VRVFAATNKDLLREVEAGRFRKDLYYRLKVLTILVPSLRERAEDIPELAKFFIRRYATKFKKRVEGVSESAMRLLQQHWWPGNIRELENLIERLVAVNDKGWIDDEDIPFEYHLAELDRSPARSESLLQDAVNTFERNFLLRALEKCEWNVTATARYLGIPLSTLKHKIGRLEVREIARRLRQ